MSSPDLNPDFVDNIEIWACILKSDHLGSDQPSPFTCVALGKWIDLSTCVIIVHAQACLTLCDPTDCSPRAPSVPWDSSGQEYWSGLLFPPPGDLFDPGIKPQSAAAPALQADSFPAAPLGKSSTCVLIFKMGKGPFSDVLGEFKWVNTCKALRNFQILLGLLWRWLFYHCRSGLSSLNPASSSRSYQSHFFTVCATPSIAPSLVFSICFLSLHWAILVHPDLLQSQAEVLSLCNIAQGKIRNSLYSLLLNLQTWIYLQGSISLVTDPKSESVNNTRIHGLIHCDVLCSHTGHTNWVLLVKQRTLPTIQFYKDQVISLCSPWLAVHSEKNSG